MIYSDLIFLLGLFPAVAILSFLDRSAEYKNLILIIFSLLFFSWGKPFAICLIFLSSLFDWAMGFLVFKNHDQKKSRAFLVADGVLNSALFLIFGHNYLFTNSALSVREEILPLGMAFYCLRGFSYVYDIYKGNAKPERNWFCLLTYMVSFHLMICGPAVRYKDIEPEIRHREITMQKLNIGFIKLFTGFGKVILLAGIFDRIKLAGLNGETITLLGSWLGMLAFFAQYYFLITGFSDMSKGMGYINGFEYPDNYCDINSKGLFWGIVKSLNTTVINFFEELFGFNKKELTNNAKTFIAAVLCGAAISIWYEAKLNFLIVGIIVGALCGVEKLFLSDKAEKVPDLIKMILLFILTVILFGGLYFDSISGYSKWLLTLAGKGINSFSSSELNSLILNNITLIIISFFVICPPSKKLIKNICGKIESSPTGYGTMKFIKTFCTASVFIVSVIAAAAEHSGV